MSSTFLPPTIDGALPAVPLGVERAISFVEDSEQSDGNTYARVYENGEWSKPILFSMDSRYQVPAKKNITKIKLVRDSDVIRFETECNKMLENGWELQGDMIVMDNMMDSRYTRLIQMFVFKE
jgi:hypothetical protein